MKRPSPLQLSALVISAVLCLFLSACGSSKSSSATNTTVSGSNKSSPSSTKAALTDLLKGNKNEKCTYTSTDPDTHETDSGTVYITNDQRMRGDFTSTDSNGQQTGSSVIRDATYEYYWQTGQTTGYKIKIADVDTTTTTIKGVTTTTVKDETTTTDLSQQDNTQYNYNCSGWTVDQSLLTPPTSVTFTDYSAQLEQSTAQAGALAQQACQQLTDPTERAACESETGGNK